MVGRAVELKVSKGPARPGGVVLDVRGLTGYDDHGNAAPDEISFQVKAGEILGVAGVQGNGQTELCEVLMGLRPAEGGSILLDGQDVTAATPRDRLRAGFGYVPEDRQEDGLVPDFSVAENLVLDVYDRPPFASGVALDLEQDPRQRGQPDRRSSMSGPHPWSGRSARCPGVTSRRSSWPGS